MKTFPILLGSVVSLMIGPAAMPIEGNEMHQTELPRVSVSGWISESDPDARLSFTRSGSLLESLEVNYELADCSAIAGRDYHPNRGMVRFEPRESQKTVLLTNVTIDNYTIEGFRAARILLSIPGNPAMPLVENGWLVLEDDERPNVVDSTFRPDERLSRGTILLGVERSGKLLVFTRLEGSPSIRRLNGNGSIDSSFRAVPMPESTLGTGEFWHRIYPHYFHAVPAEEDAWLIAWSYESTGAPLPPRLMRVRNDGALDPAFNPPEVLSQTIVRSLALDSEGRILVDAPDGLRRLNRDGELDASFHPRMHTRSLDEPYSPSAILPRSDGRIVYVAWNQAGLPEVSLLAPDGTDDASLASPRFLPGEGSYWPPPKAALQTDNKIILEGAFVGVMDAQRHGIVRLNADGTLDTAWRIGEDPSAKALRHWTLMPNDRLLVALPEQTLGEECSLLQGLTTLAPDGTVLTSVPFRGGVELNLAPNGRVITSSGGFLYEPWEGARSPAILPDRSNLPGAALYDDPQWFASEYVTHLVEGSETEIPIRRTGESSGTLSVRISAEPPGVNVSLSEETIVFAPGQTRAAVTLTVPDNDEPEPDRMITVRLSDAESGAFLSERKLLLLDDDPGLQITSIRRDPWDSADSLSVTFNAPSDEEWELQASSDLQNWSSESLEGNKGPGSVRRDWRDKSGTANPARFYRAIKHSGSQR